MDKVDEQVLIATPKREIRSELISKYLYSVCVYGPDIDELKHLLSRVFELMTEGRCAAGTDWMSILTYIGKARVGCMMGETRQKAQEWLRLDPFQRLNTFTSAEDILIDQFLIAFLRETIAHRTPVVLEECLLMMAVADVDLKGILELVLDHKSGNGPCDIAKLICSSKSSLMAGAKFSGVKFNWTGAEPEEKLIVADLVSHNTMRSFQSAAKEKAASNCMREVSNVLDILQVTRKIVEM